MPLVIDSYLNKKNKDYLYKTMFNKKKHNFNLYNNLLTLLEIFFFIKNQIRGLF